MIAPDLFPNLKDGRHNLTWQPVPDGSLLRPLCGERFHLRPAKRADDQMAFKPYEETLTEEQLKVVNAGRRDMKVDLSQPEYPKVTFLGTSSMAPGKYRNCSGILVETVPGRYILLDCAEGTVPQIYRHFGPIAAKEVLCNLKGIFISHLHVDHHMGLAGVILARRQVTKEKLVVIAPKRLAHFTNFYNATFESILAEAELVKAEHLLLKRTSKGEQVQMLYPPVRKAALEHLGLSFLATCKALHAPSSFCISLTVDKGYRLFYTGDTRPSPDVDELLMLDGKGPDLLIHEGTMEHAFLADAEYKKHSTMLEAATVGQRCNAGFTILTHFSKRYSKVPPLDENVQGERVGVAFDHMQVCPQTVHMSRKMFPALEALFQAEMVLNLRRRDRSLCSLGEIGRRLLLKENLR